MKNRGQNVCEFFSVRKSPSKKTKNRENTKIVQRNTKKVNFPHEKQKKTKKHGCVPLRPWGRGHQKHGNAKINNTGYRNSHSAQHPNVILS